MCVLSCVGWSAGCLLASLMVARVYFVVCLFDCCLFVCLVELVTCVGVRWLAGCVCVFG